MTLSDEEILARYKSNPEQGFQSLVEQFQERVYWQIRRLVKNHDDTADVMQNVFIKVWKALPEFRGDAALYTWLYRIAFNETHTFLHKASKRQTVDLDPPLFENSIEVDGKNYSPQEIENIFNKAIETLPEKQKLVFQLKYFDELKFTEIESMLGTSVGALKASYHLAVKKIEEFLKAG